MKAAIIYATMSGHSRKIAKQIASKCNLEAFDVKQNPTIEGYDMIFIISGVYSGQCMPELMEFVKTLTQSNTKSVTLLTTSMRVTKQDEIRKVLLSNGITVREEEYTCKGGFLIAAFTHPNKAEIAGAVEFATKMLVS